MTARPASERKNVRLCLCMNDVTRRRGHSITVSHNGSTSFQPIEEYRGEFRMQTDKAPQIKDEEENLKSIEREVQSLQASARSCQEQVTACQARLDGHAKQKRKLKMEMDRAQDDMTRLEGEVTASLPDLALTEMLHKELEDAQTRLEQDEAKVSTLTQRREETLRAKNKALDDVQEAELAKTDWERRLEEQRKEVESYTAHATEISPRVEVPAGQTFDSLVARLNALQKERETAETELGGSENELLEKAVDARKAYKDAEREINGTQAVRDKLKQALVTRKQRWLEFRQRITTRARIIFNYLLSERQFRGSLKVDHEKQRLDINVQPDITVQNAEGRQTKTLSGGEKSFSTICLLLALWDAMGSPIRCLDEFDVFMDSVNRDVSMNLIIGAARRAVGRQYILITPQSMNNKKVHSMDDVKIIRMEDPERGQTALNL
ncbi:hypothetical protein DM02DRAFT_380399 [Periconia macrospinosa]|uniref:P-loop containing nucleoside triphosphate hydrolase protein n=1 Tax=Periconia macrospinosa TaxID=97972 RepID=A0A2V1E8V9_9PLEO|nr:hypothetical protein DM02DRAFT_380399 [Periconia macrospinosa]